MKSGVLHIGSGGEIGQYKANMAYAAEAKKLRG